MLCMILIIRYYYIFFFNDTATTEIYTLSLHDALPIWKFRAQYQNQTYEHTFIVGQALFDFDGDGKADVSVFRDRKSTRLNSSHANISYAVFCLKKKKIKYKLLQ